MATLNDVITQTQFKSGISNTTTLPTATILTYINYGYQYLIDKIVDINEDYFEEQKTTANLVAGQAYYSLPDDFIKMKQIRIAYSTPSSDLDYNVATELDITDIDEPQYEENYSEDAPFFDITGNHYRLYPKPTSNVSNGIYLYYIARPNDLTANNSADNITGIPDPYHELLSTYAAKRVCEKFSLWDKHNRLSREFDFGVKEMQRALKPRNLNRQDRIKSIVEIGRRPYTNKRISDLDW